MSTVMMECGHSANATLDGAPACAICAGIDERALLVVPTPDLTGRIARCGCGLEKPSNPALAFFEYRGPGSRMAVDRCKNCGYSLVAHTATPSRYQRNVVERGDCPGFEEAGDFGTDSFYCGCRGWD